MMSIVVQYVDHNLLWMDGNMKIYLIAEETTYGPFFSTRERAIEYLRAQFQKEFEFDYSAFTERDNLDLNEKIASSITRVLTDRHPYISLREVELDNITNVFDG